MKRSFNVTGSCNPQYHYMVSLEDRLKKIKKTLIRERRILRMPRHLSMRLPMRFSSSQIAAMLAEYEADHHTGMDKGRCRRGSQKNLKGQPAPV